jgi:putative intracellular protease/amidase
MSRRLLRLVPLVLAFGFAAPAHAQRPLAAPITVDFDAALRSVGFAPNTTDGNGAANAPNGMLDADEMALVAAILANPGLDLRARGGIDHARVRAAWEQALMSARTDVASLTPRWAAAPVITAGYAMLGRTSFEAWQGMSESFGAPLKGAYPLALALDRWLGPTGDADGDGVSNLDEYRAHAAEGRAGYVRAALDASIATRPTTASSAPVPRGRTVVGIVLYQGFEVLDVFGPVEMWGNVPEFQVVLIAQKAGPVRSAQGVEVVATHDFSSAPPLDVMMVPGGIGTRAELQNPAFLDYLRRQHERTQVTASVCTGSVLLAKAGLLRGHAATSNKNFFGWAVDADPQVDWRIKARWVVDGKLITSSGVSAGTDMALGLVSKLLGLDRARALARALEYVWNENPDNDPFALPALPAPVKP